MKVQTAGKGAAAATIWQNLAAIIKELDVAFWPVGTWR